MFSIGEFSRVTSIPVKTLRFYHERGLLIPAAIDPDSGYRYYDTRNVDHARVVKSLRELDFSLDEIGSILADYEEEGGLLSHFVKRRAAVQTELSRQREIAKKLDLILRLEREGREDMANTDDEITEKTVPPVTVAGIRTKGRYSDMGPIFGRLGKKVGRYIAGKAMCLYYDCEYREQDADFEPCFPVREPIEREGVECHELPEIGCLTFVHRGPYEELGRSYERVLAYAKGHGYNLLTPSREVYLKGPGMIFRGNPKNYMTEIQMPFEAGA